jgi:hypothetical protein
MGLDLLKGKVNNFCERYFKVHIYNQTCFKAYNFLGDHNESLLNVSTSSVSLNPPDNETALDLSSGARERETVKSR